TCINDAIDSRGRPMVLMGMSEELIGDGDIEIVRAQNRNFALGEGFRRCARESNVLALMMRYQAQAERNYRRALEEFDRLKALRQDLPNEPSIDSTSESPNEPIPAS